MTTSTTRPLNRRQALATTALTLAGLATRASLAAQSTAPPMPQQPANAANQARTALHLTAGITAPPHRIYEALLDAKIFAAVSGLPAVIDPQPGGAFSLFAAQIGGRHVELLPDQRIVQAWRPAHWDPGVYSIVRFDFVPAADGATLDIDHKGFPAGDFDSLTSGWQEHYVERLKKYFARK